MEDFPRRIKDLHREIGEFKKILNIEGKRAEIDRLQVKMSESSFWDNPKEASATVARLKLLKDDVEGWDELNQRVSDIEELLQVAEPSDLKEVEEELKVLEEAVSIFRLRVLLQGKFDASDAIVEINAGAGGTEACDWVQMLFRMYVRWAEKRRFKVKVIDELRGDEAGYKNITFLVEGRYAYGFLSSEKGVHRLVRISPFDANKRRHTSFASVDVIPDIKDDISLDIDPKDLKIETYRASGHGGQHVNVTDSAVRITHIPTGIVASCQNERSQYQNKQTAMAVLKAKLYEFKERQRKAELEKISGEKRKIEWGSQIRSYILCPYLLVKDHRTNFEEHDAWKVLDGEIDGFINAFLKQRAGENV